MATRYDVARCAGVSTATVSRVMNDSDNVSQYLKSKVMKAVEELNYKPNLSAKGLKTQKSYNIAYLIPDITNPYYTEIYKGINLTAALSGYICSLIEGINANWCENSFHPRYDGIICGVRPNEGIMQEFKKLNLPMILQTNDIEEANSLPESAVVVHNLYQALIEAYDYIISAGHKRIGLITRSNPNNIHLKAYKKSMKKHHLDYVQNRIIEYHYECYHYMAGYNAMEHLLKNDNNVTAVIAENDLVAIGAISAAIKNGYTVPEEISFLGCDDTVAAQFSSPPLTTIKRYKEKQGRKAAEMLIDMIQGKTVQPYEFKTELIVRESIKNLL